MADDDKEMKEKCGTWENWRIYILSTMENHGKSLGSVSKELKTHNNNMAEYNKQLAIHIQGVKSIKEHVDTVHKEHDVLAKRVDKLNVPVWMMGCSTAIFMIIKVLEKFHVL